MWGGIKSAASAIGGWFGGGGWPDRRINAGGFGDRSLAGSWDRYVRGEMRYGIWSQRQAAYAQAKYDRQWGVQSLSTAGRAASRLGRGIVAAGATVGRTIQDDLVSAVIGFGGGNALGVIGGAAGTVFSAVTGDFGGAIGHARSTLAALVPRYGYTSGPDWGGLYVHLPPRHVIDRATFKHDRAYEELNDEGVGLFSPARTGADWQLVQDVWGDHRLGPIGQAYRVALSTAFLVKMGAQEVAGSLGLGR
jgi:hypothetical protein